MPSYRKSGKEFSNLINQEKAELKVLDIKLQSEKISIYNTKYLKLLSKASSHKTRIDFLKIQKHLYTKNAHKQMIIGVGSRVKLLSMRVGEVFFVDAKNYLDLLGKTIGDAVIMNNSSFLIAGVF